MNSLKADFLKEVGGCQAMLHQVCNIYTKSKEEKEDLFQEVLYQLWKSYPSFERKSKFSTWLYRVALNTAITFYGKNRKLNEYELHVQEFPNPQEEWRGADSRIEKMYETINKLGKIDKALILLFLEDKKYEEMAEILGITTSNVGVRLLRVRKKLEKMMK